MDKKQRGPDGGVIEGGDQGGDENAPTKLGEGPRVNVPQPKLGEGPRVNVPQQSGYEARTVLAKSKSADDSASDVPVEEADTAPDRYTRIYRPGARKSAAPERLPEQPTDQGAAELASDAMDDPPVGWLVVVQGPGQGKVVTLGNGMNTIGRAPSERVCLDFGDSLISRQRHALITYDPKGKKFYVQQGDGKNLTYLGDAPVLTPTELEEFSFIQMGETVLLFVPLCGERFDWAEYAE